MGNYYFPIITRLRSAFYRCNVKMALLCAFIFTASVGRDSNLY